MEAGSIKWSIWAKQKLYFAEPPYDRAGGPQVDFSPFLDLPGRVASPFFSADVGRTAAGALVLIELGDGGVSRLPPRLDAMHFYRRIRESMRLS
jgi:hypothetical protein